MSEIVRPEPVPGQRTNQQDVTIQRTRTSTVMKRRWLFMGEPIENTEKPYTRGNKMIHLVSETRRAQKNGAPF